MDGGYGATSASRCMVSHRLQSAESGRAMGTLEVDPPQQSSSIFENR
jgi:hypothetical protein